MKRPALRLALLAALCAAPAVVLWGQSQAYPQLGSLGQDDIIYMQQQEQLAQSYAAIQGGKVLPDLVVYSYVVRSAVDIFSLAARLNLPYETIATMNRMDRSRSFLPGERILVSSAPGIFAPLSPGSDLDLLLSYRPKDRSQLVSLNAGGKTRGLRFYPGARFSPEERALFLGLLFRFPLPMGILTSNFGLRESPITHHMSYHSGIDLLGQCRHHALGPLDQHARGVHHFQPPPREGLKDLRRFPVGADENSPAGLVGIVHHPKPLGGQTFHHLAIVDDLAQAGDLAARVGQGALGRLDGVLDALTETHLLGQSDFHIPLPVQPSGRKVSSLYARAGCHGQRAVWSVSVWSGLTRAPVVE